MSKNLDVAQVLKNARDILDVARLGYNDFMDGEPARRMAALRNIVTFGRSVTFVLQKLRGRADHFDAWYRHRQEEMRAEPLLQYFVQLRNEMEKEGGVGHLTHHTYVHRLHSDDISKLPRPKGATSFFIGDELGGSGWEVPQADGSTQKYYVTLPPEWGVENSFHYPDAPQVFREAPIGSSRVEDLAKLYLDYLDEVLSEAEAKFAGK